jgi:thymidine kinase
MFAGKTESLIRMIKRARDAELSIQVFVPASDSRNGVGVVRSHGGLDLEALGIGAWAVATNDAVSFASRVRPGTHIVAIDEAQFFPESVSEQVRLLLRREVNVYVAGLDCDYRGMPFGPMPQLLAMADHVQKLTAICAFCKQDNARMTYRRSKNVTEQVVLGAGETYAPACRECYGMAFKEAASLPRP